MKFLTYEEWLEANPRVTKAKEKCKRCSGTGKVLHSKCPQCKGDKKIPTSLRLYNETLAREKAELKRHFSGGKVHAMRQVQKEADNAS